MGRCFCFIMSLEQGLKLNVKSSHCASEASTTLPESSLTWCLAQLSKSSTLADSGLTGGEKKAATGGDKARDADKRLKAGQWRALVAIRTQHIKGGGGRIARYQSRGGIPPLLDLLRQPESSRKFVDLALSILANCCTERGTRLQVRKYSDVDRIVMYLRWIYYACCCIVLELIMFFLLLFFYFIGKEAGWRICCW